MSRVDRQSPWPKWCFLKFRRSLKTMYSSWPRIFTQAIQRGRGGWEYKRSVAEGVSAWESRVWIELNAWEMIVWIHEIITALVKWSSRRYWKQQSVMIWCNGILVGSIGVNQLTFFACFFVFAQLLVTTCYFGAENDRTECVSFVCSCGFLRIDNLYCQKHSWVWA